MKPLPLDGFEWCDGSAIDIEQIKKTSDDSPVGYILEVDLEYPIELHDAHQKHVYHPVRNIRNSCSLCMIKRNMWFIILC